MAIESENFCLMKYVEEKPAKKADPKKLTRFTFGRKEADYKTDIVYGITGYQGTMSEDSFARVKAISTMTGTVRRLSNPIVGDTADSDFVVNDADKDAPVGYLHKIGDRSEKIGMVRLRRSAKGLDLDALIEAFKSGLTENGLDGAWDSQDKYLKENGFDHKLIILTRPRMLFTQAVELEGTKESIPLLAKNKISPRVILLDGKFNFFSSLSVPLTANIGNTVFDILGREIETVKSAEFFHSIDGLEDRNRGYR